MVARNRISCAQSCYVAANKLENWVLCVNVITYWNVGQSLKNLLWFSFSLWSQVSYVCVRTGAQSYSNSLYFVVWTSFSEAGCSWPLNLDVFCAYNKECRLGRASCVVCGHFLLEILSRKARRELVPCVSAAVSAADCRMLWPGFGNQPAVCPCHLPGRHPLPQLLLLAWFILQTEPEEPGTWAKNNPLEGSRTAPSALELVLVSGRALGWAVAAGQAGTSPGDAWAGCRGKEGRNCPMFEPCPKLYSQIQTAGSICRAWSSHLPQMWLPASCQSRGSSSAEMSLTFSTPSRLGPLYPAVAKTVLFLATFLSSELFPQSWVRNLSQAFQGFWLL